MNYTNSYFSFLLLKSIHIWCIKCSYRELSDFVYTNKLCIIHKELSNLFEISFQNETKNSKD